MERVTLAEAARRAGIATAILRKRAQRGTLAGALKVGGAWYVELRPGTPDQDTTRPHPPAGTRTPDGRDTDARPDARWAGQVASLEREVARLWEELEARRGEVRELHTLLAQAQARPALAAAENRAAPRDSEVVPAPGQPAPRRAPWWRRMFGWAE